MILPHLKDGNKDIEVILDGQWIQTNENRELEQLGATAALGFVAGFRKRYLCEKKCF